MGNEEPKGYALADLAHYIKLKEEVAPKHHWDKRIVLKDKNRNSPVMLSGNIKYTEYKLADAYVANAPSIPDGELVLSIFDIWRDELKFGYDNKRLMAPELIWGEEIKSHDGHVTEIHYVCYRRFD